MWNVRNTWWVYPTIWTLIMDPRGKRDHCVWGLTGSSHFNGHTALGYGKYGYKFKTKSFMRPQTHFKTVNPLEPAAMNVDKVFHLYSSTRLDFCRSFFKFKIPVLFCNHSKLLTGEWHVQPSKEMSYCSFHCLGRTMESFRPFSFLFFSFLGP